MTEDTDSQTVGLIINLVIGIPTVLICSLLFDIFRKRVPSVFEARRILNDRRDPLDYNGDRIYSLPPPSYRFFGWIGPVLRLELDTIAKTHGLDAALYLKYLQSMTILFFVMIITSFILIPVFFTADNKNLPQGDPHRTIGIQRFSLSNVPEDDRWRFWIVLVVEYAITSFVCVFLFRQFAEYGHDRIRYRTAKYPQNYSILVQDIPSSSFSEDSVRHYWERFFPGLVEYVHPVYDGRKLVAKKQEFWNAVTKRERSEWDMEFNEKLAGARPMHKTGICSCCRGASVKVDSIRYWTEQQDHCCGKISVSQQNVDVQRTPPTNAAIVVFKTRQAAAVAAQTNFASKESEWRVTRAPEPNAVNWNALSIGSMLLTVRSSITVASSVLLILFWFIPVAAIMSLVNLSALAGITINGKRPFSFLDSVADWSPTLTGIIESLLPAIILSVFLSLVPTILRVFVSVSRIESLAKMDNIIRDWYFIFVTFSNFLFIAFSGTLLSAMKQIIAQPGSTVNLLATAVPNQAGFIMNFILLKALLETPQQLLQISRVIIRWAKLKFLARTPRERNNVDTGNTIFDYLSYYAMAQLIGLLGIIYSTVQPFVTFVSFAYFAINYVVWKYNLCYSLHNPFQDGGSMHGGALYGLWIGLLTHLLTMIGLFGLYNKPTQSVLAIVPAVFAVWFICYCRKSYDRFLEHGSGADTYVRVQKEDDGEDVVPDGLPQKYIHPGFDPLPDPVENMNGVDGNNGEVRCGDAEDPENSIDNLQQVTQDDDDNNDYHDDNDNDDGPLAEQSPLTEDWNDTHSHQIPT